MDSTKQIPDPAVFEKLGVFYLGATRESVQRGALEPLLYDSRDLTTHMVCVGMTGSGKTGLCTCLLEEAALDGVPAIAIDLKGDISNLLLGFPDLSAESFAPWLDPGAAERKGQTVAEFAEATAAMWKQGLAAWGEDGARIAALQRAVEMRIFTPGSDSGLPLSVLKSFSAPSAELLADCDALRERIAGSVSGLLSLLGIEADPLRSREHILLASILENEWRSGRDCGLPELIRLINTPPFTQVGILDLDSFFPAKERMYLASTLNNLLASPSFAAWAMGEPLDIQSMLWSPQGRPRLSIIYVAHLSEAERMFIVTLLLNELVAWVRRQSGTGSLRALFYMDEVFGYLPPVANPPSKAPLLTLLKQARAFGLGLVLATQNPVDLDYKALSNAGTWLLGRLQTDRDKQRMLDGLIGAQGGSGLRRSDIEEIITGLDGREFLLHNVHADGPVVMSTRWALSYLCGPLSREQIRLLTAGRPPDPPVAAAPAATVPASATAEKVTTPAAARPLLPTEAAECFQSGTASAGYRPALWGSLTLHYVDSKRGWDVWRDVELFAMLDTDSGADPWDAAEQQEPPQLRDLPVDGASYAALPPRALKPASYATWRKSLASHAYQTCRLPMLHCAELKLSSGPDESERDFAARVSLVLREERDAELDKLHDSFAAKIARIEERLDAAQRRLSSEQADAASQRMDSYLSVGGAILGSMFGSRRLTRGRLGSARAAARSVNRSRREQEDIVEAEARVDKYTEELHELRGEMAAALSGLQAKYAPTAAPLEQLSIAPRKSDIQVRGLRLIWLAQ